MSFPWNGFANAVFSLLILAINTVLCTFPILLLAPIKLVLPKGRWRSRCDSLLNAVASNWISVNNFAIAATQRIVWDVRGIEGLRKNGWYLVLSNHQTWTDIVVLQKIFNRKIPFLKFFVKKELIYVPLLGLAWWAMDFPFMKRYSKAKIARRPELRGQDLITTLAACEKFKKIPISIMNFVEGTRFTKTKKERQASPYRHLLRPRAAGVAMVLASMGSQLDSILDVTIVYSGENQSFWGFLCGRVPEIRVRVRALPVEEHLLGDYFNDAAFKRRFHDWLNQLWQEKDSQFQAMLPANGQPW